MRISEATRDCIIHKLLSYDWELGHMRISAFVESVFPKVKEMPSKEYKNGRATAIEEIKQRMENNDDWDYEELFCEYLNLLCVEDNDFIYFLEKYIYTMIIQFRKNNKTDFEAKCIEDINQYLVKDEYKLVYSGNLREKVIYSVISLNTGVKGSIKNIIFACIRKPDIIIENAFSNDIKVNNKDKCLIYDKPILGSGISWNELKCWYKDISGNKNNLEDRLMESLDSKPEKLFLKTYIEIMNNYNGKLPALIPQVYLYYDPRLAKDRTKKIFEHQRIDFMMIFSENQRVVIEIDGIQHYSERSDNNGKYYPSVEKYAEMVAAQREMTLAGYDVYRFGGKELYDDITGKEIISKFLKRLFEKYGVETNKIQI